MTTVETPLARSFDALALTVLQRDWLSSNHIVFRASGGRGAVVVDTGYDSHSALSCALIEHALHGEPLARIVNTHLHSDHCGGNAALQARHACETWVPQPSFDAVRAWDMQALSFDQLDQVCRRFSASHALAAGSSIELGGQLWQAHAAPGHDPDALMFFQPEARVLITGDALWEDRVAIIFPELEGGSGFAEANAALDVIEALNPAIVIPGHGRPFNGVGGALAQSRARLARFAAEPASHVRYAWRALVMFHLLARQPVARSALIEWMAQAPLFVRLGGGPAQADTVIEGLLRDGVLAQDAQQQLSVQ